MGRLLIIFVCLIGIINAESPANEKPELTAPVGQIRGSILTSRLGRTIYSYRGVRFAEPPTGQLRFEPPVLITKWNSVFDASQEGPSCPSLTSDTINEDCLRLNVYTTEPPSKCRTAKKPVLVFIHPGGFYAFSGQSFNYGPEYLMDKDIVLVTVNCRLGMLGFMSTGDSLAPGNLAFKDQVAALKWIKRNIAAFGGDPDNVTISGSSAGSMSVMLHMLSPMSRHLFHRVIAMSASITGAEPEFTIPYDQKDLAIKQAKLLDCPFDTTASMLSCLRTKPVENFTSTMAQFFEWYASPTLLYKPVVEPEGTGVERFLTAQPVDLFRLGRFYQVPMIVGITKDEFGGISLAFEQPARQGNDSLYRELDRDWEKLAPINFLYQGGTTRSKSISSQLREFYFGNKPINSATQDGVAHIYADSLVIFPVWRAARLIAAKSSQPVYFYKFSYQGRYSFSPWKDNTTYGVVHHDDLQYLFYWKVKFPYMDTNAPEYPVSDMFTSIVSNFAKTGEPIPKNNDLTKNVKWDRFVPAQDNFLEITQHPTMKTGIYPDRMQAWDRIFPLRPVQQSGSNVKA